MGFKEVKMQFLAAVVVALQASGYGIINGWSSPNNIKLRSDTDNPLPSGKLTEDEISLTSSVVGIGALVGILGAGLIANKYGRKWPILLLTIPITVSWLLIWFAQNVNYLYVGRAIQGAVEGAIFSLCQFYFIEISDASVRGTLCASTVLAGHIGVPVAFALGYLDWAVTPIFSIALSVLAGILMYWFPETPTFLVKQNKIKEAEKSIRFYKNLRANPEANKIVQIEMENIKSEMTLAQTDMANKSSAKLSDFFTNPGRKAMIIGIVLAALNHLTGSFVLIAYAGTVFQKSGSALSPNDSALIIGFIQLIGTFLVPLSIEWTGRKVLYGISTVSSVVGFAFLGTYLMFQSWGYAVSHLNWIPIVCCSFVVLAQSLGVSTLSYTVTAEVMPENIKEIGITVSNFTMCAFGTLVLQFMNNLDDAMGQFGTMYLFGAFSIPSAVFVLFYVPETRNKSYEQIMAELK
ncbi:hypothetical protein HA402_014457 [Bradysia odoriphaga]|nr:hypothetical protein HA402_014457 [Bradysia odoriphaga]